MRKNTKVTGTQVYTHEGARAFGHTTPLEQLRRSVLTCLLWENTFYEDGIGIADRIATLVKQCKPEDVAAMAIEARSVHNLRHVPLLLVRELARHPARVDHTGVAKTLAKVIQRADELSEFLAIYFDGHDRKAAKQKLSKQVRRGLSWALKKFDQYALAKYDQRDAKIKLRDVLFMTHAKPTDRKQEALWKNLINDTLPVPRTWETELSAGKDKRKTFETLMAERELGAMAFLRNLRNMHETGVPRSAVEDYAKTLDVRRALPFRFISAARAVPQWEPILEPLMLKCMQAQEKFDGPTALLVDHSGSMESTVSDKSQVTRFDAASAIGILLREVCTEFRVFTFSDFCIEVPARHGFALRDAIKSRINPAGTLLGAAVKHVYEAMPECERLIVVTDEQSHDTPPAPRGRGYVINVAPYQNGVGYGAWMHIDGWSEGVIRFIAAMEKEQ